ncbi:MAG: hypothetical protein KUL88_16770 [Rhizobium sp.]|nr:hypothetical protein [Rhizobium sp.]
MTRIAQIRLMQTFVTLLFSTMLLGEHIGIETIIFAIAVAFAVRLGRKARISRTFPFTRPFCRRIHSTGKPKDNGARGAPKEDQWPNRKLQC